MGEDSRILVSFNPNEKFEREMQAIIAALSVSDDQIQTAIIRAINRVSDGLKNAASREIAREMRIKLDIIKKRFRVFKAKKNKPNAMVSLFTHSIPLILLDPKPYGKGLVTNTGDYYSGAFIARNVKRNKSEKLFDIAFKRQGRERYPLTQVRYPIRTEAERVMAKYAANVAAKLEERIIHELKQIGGFFKDV